MCKKSPVFDIILYDQIAFRICRLRDLSALLTAFQSLKQDYLYVYVFI